MEREGVMNIGIAIQDFITVHEIENQSLYTIRNYRRHLENFRAWVQSVHWNYDIRIRDSAQSVEERPVESRERKGANAVAHESGWQIRRGGKSHRLAR